MALRFEAPQNPNATGRPRLFTESMMEELRARPGEWAIILESSPRKLHQNAASWRRRDAYRGFEFAVRCMGDEGKMYARWIGTEDK